MKIKKYIKKAKKKSPRLFSTAKFILKFNLLAIPMYIVLLLRMEIQQLKDITAGIVFFVLQSTGIDVAMLPNNLISIPISGGSWAAFIDWDCTGWKSMYALFALIFATNFSARKKFYGLLLLPLVYIINIARIWFMFFYVSNYGLAYFSIVHAFVWSWGLIAVILILWVLWIRWALGNKFILIKSKGNRQ